MTTQVPTRQGQCGVAAPGPKPGQQKIKPSRAGPWRAAVLGLVQLLMIVHVVHWLIAGSTFSPVEPSEAGQTVRHGVINAGAVFFALALLATLIFGRWFCGWGCHLVMLQDFCGWLMKKIGIRPRAFRSRFLIYVPLGIAFKMFLWPLVDRFVIIPLSGESPNWPGFKAEFFVTDFWHTFPGVALAVPFLLVCGFGTVYFLGAKGFCTYGCPYGGFFAPLDKFAVGRIRVNDNCHQCRHCTAVCTSNVQVHAEVREYGMVVDPGCMKCMDCVSVCPNDALSFSFGKPAVPMPAPRNKAPRRSYDLTLGEEFAFSAFLILAIFSLTDVYSLVPLLMAGGWSIVATFLLYKAWRMWRDSRVSLYRWRLKWKGRVTRVGWLFQGVAWFSTILILHSGVVKLAGAVGDQYAKAVSVPETVLFATRQRDLIPSQQKSLERAERWYGIAASFPRGGIGLIADHSLMYRQAVVAAATGNLTKSAGVLEELLQRTGHFKARVDLAQTLLTLGRDVEAVALYEEALQEEPERIDVRKIVAEWHARQGHVDETIELYRNGVELHPGRAEFRYQLGRWLLQRGDVREGVEQLETVLEKRRRHFQTLKTLTRHYYESGDFKNAAKYGKRAMAVDAADPVLQSLVQSIPASFLNDN